MPFCSNGHFIPAGGACSCGAAPESISPDPGRVRPLPGGSNGGGAGLRDEGPSPRRRQVGRLSESISGVVAGPPGVVGVMVGTSSYVLMMFVLLAFALLISIAGGAAAAVSMLAVTVVSAANLATLVAAWFGVPAARRLVGMMAGSQSVFGRSAPAMVFRVETEDGPVPVVLAGREYGVDLGDEVDVRGYRRYNGEIRATWLGNHTIGQSIRDRSVSMSLFVLVLLSLAGMASLSLIAGSI